MAETVTVTLQGLTHPRPFPLHILLVSPQEQNVMLMARATDNVGATNVTVTFDQDATTDLYNGRLLSGTYLPSNFRTNSSSIPGFPHGPYSSDLTSFSGVDPNGEWNLYIYDELLDAQTSQDGVEYWTLNLRTTGLCCSGRNSRPELLRPAWRNGEFSFSFVSGTDATYYVEKSQRLNPEGWQIIDQIAGDGTPKQVSDQMSLGAHGFYRLRVE